MFRRASSILKHNSAASVTDINLDNFDQLTAGVDHYSLHTMRGNVKVFLTTNIIGILYGKFMIILSLVSAVQLVYQAFLDGDGEQSLRVEAINS